MQVAAIKADVTLSKAKPQDLRRSLNSFASWVTIAHSRVLFQEKMNLEKCISEMQMKLQ